MPSPAGRDRLTRSAAATRPARSAARRARASPCRSRTVCVGAVPVGLVDHEHVGDLEDAGLGGLDPVAHARRQQHQRGVGGRGDLDLGLADADGLDQHHVAAGRVQHPDGLRGRRGQPAEVAAGGHRPDEHAGVGRVVLHPHPVAEQRPAGERRGRVDREHADPVPLPAQRPTSIEVEVDLPTPGEPVSPITRARPVCGASAAATSRSGGEASSTSEISRATDRASPSRARADQRRRRPRHAGSRSPRER